MTLRHTHQFEIKESNSAHLLFTSSLGATIEVLVLEEDIIRVVVLPKAILHQTRTWSIAPGVEDVEVTGRDRMSLDGFSLPKFESTVTPEHFILSTQKVRLTLQLQGGFLSWEIKKNGEWFLVAQDRQSQAYNLGYWDEKVYHYLNKPKGEVYFGLGERAGNLNRVGERYEMRNIDAMGYNAEKTDPLYKHIPFYITWKPEQAVGFGLFYDNMSDCIFDMGRELDNYHGHYRHYIAQAGDLDYYFIAAPQSPVDATKRFTWLTGRPAYMPKWSIGYSGSTMTYTDAPDAAQQLQKFISGCRDHDILCDSFHLSSGYTSIGDKRYVFHWNNEKFPDVKGFVHGFLADGVRLCANIKPCLLVSHPEFSSLAQKSLFINDQEGTPLLVQFWGEFGAYLDFTNPVAIDWWKMNVKAKLLAYGIAATWNDNNEFEIWSKDGLANGFGLPMPAHETKVLQTMLMIKSSKEAQNEYAPNTRPFLISRSGGAGMQRYVQTWSGDNYTSWHTLKFNIKMGIGLSLSGVSNTGHDIGGFAGPAPSEELFVRWVEYGIFLPRFSIHSWNDDKTVNEPWMYPNSTAMISELIKLRGLITPYLYDLLAQSHTNFEPILLPTSAVFTDDLQCFEENDDMLLGCGLLLAATVEEGAASRKVYLPKGQSWASFQTGEIFQGEQTVQIAAPLGKPNFFIKEGFGIPVNTALQSFNQASDVRGFFVFPTLQDGSTTVRCVEDDGLTESWRNGEQGFWQINFNKQDELCGVTIKFTGDQYFAKEELEIMIPNAYPFEVVFTNAILINQKEKQGWISYSLLLKK